MQNVETALVSRIPGTLFFHTAEWTHRNRAIFITTPGTTPVLKLDQFERCLLYKILNHILITQPVTATDGIVEMHLE